MTLACLLLACLVWAGLCRVSRGQGELLGRACPPPLILHAGPRRLDLSLYDLKIRVALPEAVPRAGAAIVRRLADLQRGMARLARRWAVMLPSRPILGWPGHLLHHSTPN